MPGRLHVELYESSALQRRRKLRIWLPAEWDQEPTRQFPLIVASDAQMKFSERDGELPYGSWGLDQWIERLGTPVIVAAVDNSPQRVREYFPLTDEFGRYQQFVINELIPWLRAHFRAIPDARATAHIGSSMGGILGFALTVNNPQVIGTGLCLSPWFEVEGYKYIHEVLRKLEHKPPVRIYMDSGIQDWRMLDDGHRGTLMARLELLRLGFAEGQDLDWIRDLFFPTMQDLESSQVKPDKREAAIANQHTEYHWNRRLERPLRFFFKGL